MSDIIFITIAAVISGAETWNDIELYGDTNKTWLGEYLELPNGITRHDSFNRFFSAVDTQSLEQSFLDWISQICSLTKGDIVSIDGKALRGSQQRGSKSIVHMACAWSSANQLSLGQRKVDDKSNEITAIPKLLDAISLEGCTVTLDAKGCQVKVAQAIIGKRADYVLAIKANQGTLLDGIKDVFRFTKPIDSFTQTGLDSKRW